MESAIGDRVIGEVRRIADHQIADHPIADHPIANRKYMDLRRRFVFRGNASVIGGRIVRPTDVVIDSSTASSLTVAGGRSQSRTIGRLFGDYVRHGAASTFAEGVFDDVKQQVELTYGRVSEDSLTTSTRVNADVRDLAIGARPRLTVRRLHAALNSRSPAASNEPPIGVGADTVVEGAAIDGKELVVRIDAFVFQKYDTYSRLMAAVDDPAFVKEYGDHFYMKDPVAGRPAPPQGYLSHCYGTTYATIVRSISWAVPTDPYPGAKISRNTVFVPDLGTIFFGELLISQFSRRLTMVRTELGSPVGGALAVAEVEDNGSWST
jgi:hypothetical protein